MELVEHVRNQINEWLKIRGHRVFWPSQFVNLFAEDYETTVEALLILEQEGFLQSRVRYYNAVGDTVWEGTTAERGKVRSVAYEGVEIRFELVKKGSV